VKQVDYCLVLILQMNVSSERNEQDLPVPTSTPTRCYRPVPKPRKTLENKVVSAQGGNTTSHPIPGPSHLIQYNDIDEVEELELCAAKPATHHYSPIRAVRESVQHRSAYGRGTPSHPTIEASHTPARRNILTEFNEASISYRLTIMLSPHFHRPVLWIYHVLPVADFRNRNL